MRRPMIYAGVDPRTGEPVYLTTGCGTGSGAGSFAIARRLLRNTGKVYQGLRVFEFADCRTERDRAVMKFAGIDPRTLLPVWLKACCLAGVSTKCCDREYLLTQTLCVKGTILLPDGTPVVGWGQAIYGTLFGVAGWVFNVCIGASGSGSGAGSGAGSGPPTCMSGLLYCTLDNPAYGIADWGWAMLFYAENGVYLNDIPPYKEDLCFAYCNALGAANPGFYASTTGPVCTAPGPILEFFSPDTLSPADLAACEAAGGGGGGAIDTPCAPGNATPATLPASVVTTAGSCGAYGTLPIPFTLTYEGLIGGSDVWEGQFTDLTGKTVIVQYVCQHDCGGGSPCAFAAFALVGGGGAISDAGPDTISGPPFGFTTGMTDSRCSGWTGTLTLG